MDKSNKSLGSIVWQIAAVCITVIVYLIPFFFVIINSLKTKKEAGLMSIGFPEQLQFSQVVENYTRVLTASKYLVLRAFANSILLTAISVCIIILFTSMLAYIIQRRKGKLSSLLNFFILAGLIIPVSIVPTYRLLQSLHINGTFFGLVMVEVATQTSFATILFRGYFPSIPKEIDEAGTIDGCGPIRLFFNIILPLAKPVISAVVVLVSLHVYNDFTNPLYFFPGNKNVTVQLSIYTFYGMFESSWNLIFADVVLISIPVLILYIVFNKRIETGMVSGAVKG